MTDEESADDPDEPKDSRVESKDDEEGEPTEKRKGGTGFRFAIGLRPLSDLLGIDVSYAPWSDLDAEQAAGDETLTPAEADDCEVGRAREEPTSRYHVSTSRKEDEIAVTADLPGVSKDDLSVGFDLRRSALVIAVEGTVVERVSLPWPARADRVQFNNGVLEIRVSPDEDASTD